MRPGLLLPPDFFRHPVFKSSALTVVIAEAKRAGQPVYLVGGFLRDVALGHSKNSLDLDFAVASGAIDFGRRVARALKAAFVVLDQEHGCGRVVIRDKKTPGLTTFDFVDFRGKDLKEDLLKRDFTINALACPLPPGSRPLIDLCNGLNDIKRRRLRVVYGAAFDDDPLRIVRAYSMSAVYGLKIDEKTRRLIRRKKELLKTIAGERLREEFFKILCVPDALKTIRAMDRDGVLVHVIPQLRVMRRVKQGGYHHLDVWGHSLEAFKKCEDLVRSLKADQDVASYLTQTMAGERTRLPLIKLAVLLHDIGKPQTYRVKEGKTMFHGHERVGRDISRAIFERLKLSTRERFALETMIFWHLRPGYLADMKTLTERAAYRYFRDTKEEAASVLLVAIADQRATRGPMTTRASHQRHEKVSFELLKRYFAKLKEKPFVRLITGDDLIKKLKLTPGPSFAKILDAVEEAQAAGEVRTKTQALALAKKTAKKV